MTGPITTIGELRMRLDAERAAGRTVAFVPTMGALHDGHLALVRHATEVADVVVVSIFVNPLQFGPSEDLDRYPRTLEADVAALAPATIVFAPTATDMYPDGEPQIHIAAGHVATLFEGATRPGHFDGMLTVVAKLFNIVQPTVAVFGQKDAQQVYLVRRMIADLNLPLELDIVETVREPDGLALSSRNRYLGADERRAALVLSAALEAAAACASQGADFARVAGRNLVADEPLAELDYFDLVDPATFLPVPPDFRGTATAIIAARVGTTRLIDNREIMLP
ncbi:pantoate--beta-alanine ligase [Homoserinimonas sp. A447]